jgi:hypothetical protein
MLTLVLTLTCEREDAGGARVVLREQHAAHLVRVRVRG